MIPSLPLDIGYHGYWTLVTMVILNIGYQLPCLCLTLVYLKGLYILQMFPGEGVELKTF